MVRVGKVYDASTDFRKKSVFARIVITYVRKEKLGSIDENGIRKEGCSSIQEFRTFWTDSYGSWDPDAEVYVIGFRLLTS